MPDIYCPLLEDGKPVVRPPKAEVDYFFDGSGIRRAWFDRPGNEPIYTPLSSDEYVVVRKDDLERLVGAARFSLEALEEIWATQEISQVARWTKSEIACPRLENALAPFGKEKTDG